MAKLILRSDGLEGFKKRVLTHAQALDRGETLPSESTISFASVDEMFHVLTPKRILLLEALATGGPQTVASLARDLGRKDLPVMKDIALFKNLGILKTAGGKTLGITNTLVRSNFRRFDFIYSIRKRNMKSAPEAQLTNS